MEIRCFFWVLGAGGLVLDTGLMVTANEYWSLHFMEKQCFFIQFTNENLHGDSWIFDAFLDAG